MLAQWVIWDGDFSTPPQWLEEARKIHHQLGSVTGEATVLHNYALIEYWQGNYQQAQDYLVESFELYEKAGVYMSSLWVRVNMAYTQLRQGDVLNAKEMFTFCIEKFQKAGNIIGVCYAIEGLASLHVNQNQHQRAIQLFTWADAMREKFNDQRPPVEHASVEKDLATIRSQIPEDEFDENSEKGRTMTVEQAVALALEE